jgi:hypothetical protein
VNAKEPEPSATTDPTVFDGEPKEIVTLLDGGKSTPDTVTEVPAKPVLGERVIDGGGVTVKVALAESPVEPVAVNVVGPRARPKGTLTVEVKEPMEFATEVPDAIPPKESETVSSGENEWPEIETKSFVATKPNVGDKMIEGRTVKGALAETPPPEAVTTATP